MALATLKEPEAVEGGTAYEVETWPEGEPPFRGPDDRDWSNFQLTDEGATFEWRTGADRVRRAAGKVAGGEWTMARARKDPFVERWLDGDRLAGFLEIHDDEPELESLPDAKLARRMLVEAGAALDNEPGLLGYYREDDDAFLEDALRSLDLPAWASVETFSDGGPGTGFTNAALLLQEGKTLRDLASWLEVRAARSPQHVDILPRSILRAKGRLGLTHQPGGFWPGRPVDSDERLRADLRGWKKAYRASSVVTLLAPGELANLGRIDLAARRAGLGWSHFPVPDLGIPSLPDAARRCAAILRTLNGGKTVILHCKAGLGRSGLVAACVLVLSGMPASEAIAAVRAARPGAIESPAQEAFVREFAERNTGMQAL